MSQKVSIYEKYTKLSETLQDKILLMRVGEFYEIFGKNAEILSKKLGITITYKGNYNSEKVMMCGFPAKSKNLYFRKLLDLNYKIAIVNINNISENSKLKAKELIRFITPGTVLEEDFINDSFSRFVIFIYSDIQEKKSYIASIDITVGHLELYSFTSNFNRINAIIHSIDPREIIVQNNEIFQSIDKSFHGKISIIETEEKIKFDKIATITSLSDNLFFNHEKFNDHEINTIYGLLNYIKSIHDRQNILLKKVASINLDDYCEISESSFYGLEIFKDFLGNSKNTLFNFLNQTKTPMGSRLLKRYVTRPEISAYIINKRLETVEYLINNQEILANIQVNLSEIGELERSVIRFVNNINAKNEIERIRCGFSGILSLFKILSEIDKTEIISDVLKKINNAKKFMNNFQNIFLSRDDCVSETLNIKQIINPEINPVLDSFVAQIKNLDQEISNYILEFSNKYKTKAKIAFDSVKGLHLIINPSDFENIIEKFEQILISKDKIKIKTEKTKEINEKIDLLEKKIKLIEEKIIKEEIINTKNNISALLEAVDGVAVLDCLASFAKISIENSFCKPNIVERSENIFEIIDGYHPSLISSGSKITSNDTKINENSKMLIITGPNMGGKSTFVKQNGIIAILSQIGCFVPAKETKLSIVDKIFTRVGAIDILKEGKSTFYMEMLDIKNIIENATESSLCLLDEICIGTSQKEGYIILFEILQYISSKIKAKTILATHYHEIQNDIESLINASHLAISSSLENNKMVFDYKLKSIKTDSSYPMNVLKMLNFPIEISDKITKKLN